jgi:hypothetical protein
MIEKQQCHHQKPARAAIATPTPTTTLSEGKQTTAATAATADTGATAATAVTAAAAGSAVLASFVSNEQQQ